MTRRLLALPVLLSAFAGCKNDDTDFWLYRNDLLTTASCARKTFSLQGSCNRTSFAFDDRVAFIEKTSATAFVLDPADPALKPRMEKLGKAPVLAVKRNGSNKLMVLTRGDRGSAEKPAIPAELDVIDANPQVPIERHELGGRFDAIAQSPDGRFLVLYHSPNAQAQDDSALYNPNELLLFDFTPPANPAVPSKVGKSIRSLGGVPTDVLYSPPYTFLGGPRTLAVVMSQNYITILDLNNPERIEISVPLCPQSTGCNLTPEQVLFDPANLNIYVRATGAKDIFQIKLTDLETVAPPPPSNDFHASLSMLAVGSVPADMALYGTGASTRIAVAAPEAKSLVIIDPSTSRSIGVGTAIPINTIIPFVAATAPALLPKPQALLVDTVRNNTSVLFADLETVETTGGLAIADYPLAAAAQDAPALVDQGIVLLIAGNLSGSNALTVVDLATRSFKQIGARNPLAAPVIETRSPTRLWSIDQGTVLAHLNLVPRAGEPVDTGETWLDQGIDSIVPLTALSADLHRYVLVGHPDPNGVGNVTFIDADKPDRATARTAYGFLLTDYLEREQP